MELSCLEVPEDCPSQVR